MEPLQVGKKTIDWLLNPADPALRYKVLTLLLDTSETNKDVQKTKKNISTQPWIKTTLAAQSDDGSWGRGFYTKYDGTSWVMLHLSEVGCPADDPHIKKGVEYLLNEARPVENMTKWEGKFLKDCEGGMHWRYPIACLNANVSTILIRYGELENPIIQAALKSVRHLFREGEGFECQVMDYYSLLPKCYMTVPIVLKTFSEIPVNLRKPEDQTIIRRLIELLYKYDLYKYQPVSYKEWHDRTRGAKGKDLRILKQKWIADGKLEPRQEKSGWKQFNFPKNYNSDLLEVLLLLGREGEKRNSAIDNALEVVLSKKNKDNQWKMVGGFNNKMWAELDKKGKPSPWVTFRALLALKYFGLLVIDC